MAIFKAIAVVLFLVLSGGAYFIYKSDASKELSIDCGGCMCCKAIAVEIKCSESETEISGNNKCNSSACVKGIGYVKCNNDADRWIVAMRNRYNMLLENTR